MKNISITFGHGCAITFDINGSYFIVELERLLKKRHTNIFRENDLVRCITQSLDIAKKFYGIENSFDNLIIPCDIKEHVIGFSKVTHPLTIDALEKMKSMINFKKLLWSNHHENHAACAAYQSPFDQATVVSFDGVGNDGNFNIYHYKNNKIFLIKKIKTISMGRVYRKVGYLIKDIKIFRAEERFATSLNIAGKLMGLVAYGKIRPEWIPAFDDYFETQSLEKLSNITGFPISLDDNVYKSKDHPLHNLLGNIKVSGDFAQDLAATNQHAWEERFFRLIDPYLKKGENIVLTGGCALNVLLNEKVRKKYGDRVFVCPNTDDSGQSLGQALFVNPPDSQIDVTYAGLPILDIEQLEDVKKKYVSEPAIVTRVVKLLQQGNIIGVLRGKSEVGPRALGNRSIICDPRYPDMKDKLNKIKNREWFRPFAPMVRYEDRNKYFDFTHESRFMSFGAMVRSEFRDTYPSITHIDGTARLQTVKADQNKFIYDLLTEIDGLLLNTSFNINGNPMLTTIEDALHVLNNTSLDYLIIENTLVSKHLT